jgi:hypothetical protein
MNSRFIPEKRIPNARVARPVSRRIFGWLSIIALAGTFISAGFIISARQHIEAVSLGYKSEPMRNEARELEERLHQLELEYARVTTPFEVAKKAEKLGLERPGAASQDKAEAANKTKDKTKSNSENSRQE